MKHPYDVIVVGGSVAGAAAAIRLGRAGFRVLVLDRATLPREKACGEGIMPAGVRDLSELGLLASLRGEGAQPFYGITFVDHHGCRAVGTFPDAGEWPGLVIRRLHFDRFLLETAASTPGVEVRQNFRVTRILEHAGRVSGVAGREIRLDETSEESFAAPITVGADGLQSMFHRLKHIRVRRPRRQRFGVRAHLHRFQGLDARVEVVMSREGEVYIARHGPDTAMVALLLERGGMKPFAGDVVGGFWQTLHSVKALSERVEKSQLISSIMVTGPLGSRVGPCVGDGFLLLGDSAGALDPITGEGMALGLRSARLAAAVIAGALGASDVTAERLSGYEAGRREMLRPIAFLTHLLLTMSRHESLAHGAIRQLNAYPKLLDRFLGVASGLHSFRSPANGLMRRAV